MKIKAPRNANEVCAFLGLLNYYYRFIPAFTDLMHPTQKLLKKMKNSNGQKNVTRHFELQRKYL